VTRYRGKSTSQWQNETAQFGIRMGVTFGDTVPAYSAGDWTMPGGSVVDASFTESNTTERREFGFSNDGATDAYSLAFQGAVINLFLSAVTSLRNDMAASYQFDQLRLYAVKGDGTSPTEPTIVTPLDTTYNPTTSPNSTLAPQNAAVVSFNTALRTRKGRGRIYLGPLKVTANSETTGLLASGTRETAVSTFVTLFEGLRNISSSAGVAVGVPIVWHKPGDRGAVINAVRIDDQLDVQRRREGQRTPVWEETALV